MPAPKGQLAAGALSLVVIVGLLALGFSGMGRDTGGGSIVLLTQGLSASSPSTDGVRPSHPQRRNPFWSGEGASRGAIFQHRHAFFQICKQARSRCRPVHWD